MLWNLVVSLTGIETKNDGLNEMNEFNQESLAATDKWGHHLSDRRWVTSQRHQHNEEWRALCETLSLQYTAQSCIIVTMYWFSLDEVPEIALHWWEEESVIYSVLPAFIHPFHSFSSDSSVAFVYHHQHTDGMILYVLFLSHIESGCLISIPTVGDGCNHTLKGD